MQQAYCAEITIKDVKTSEVYKAWKTYGYTSDQHLIFPANFSWKDNRSGEYFQLDNPRSVDSMHCQCTLKVTKRNYALRDSMKQEAVHQLSQLLKRYKMLTLFARDNSEQSLSEALRFFDETQFDETQEFQVQVDANVTLMQLSR